MHVILCNISSMLSSDNIVCFYSWQISLIFAFWILEKVACIFPCRRITLKDIFSLVLYSLVLYSLVLTDGQFHYSQLGAAIATVEKKSDLFQHLPSNIPITALSLHYLWNLQLTSDPNPNHFKSSSGTNCWETFLFYMFYI